MDDVSGGQLLADVAVVRGLDPKGEVVFLPTDSRGTPGRLNTAILKALGLSSTAMPRPLDLAQGFFLRRMQGSWLCFVVSVGPAGAAQLLRDNLTAALRAPEIQSLTHLWIPLMGTGEGRLSYSQSESIIRYCLTTSGWLAKPKTRIEISYPPEGVAQSSNVRISKLETLSKALSSDAPSPKPSGTKSEKTPEEAAVNHSPTVKSALRFASGLKRLRAQKGGRLSTSLLFFALVESQAEWAPIDLRDDPSAARFSDVVGHLSSRYDDGWKAYFASPRPTAPLALPGGVGRGTSNIEQVLAAAETRAASEGRRIVEMDDLIRALLGLQTGRYDEALKGLGLTRAQIEQAYLDERAEEIASRLFNDVAHDRDELGYAAYARAIAEFLLDDDTHAPLSISIQAPWGVGKSSLMHQIREKLDPKAEREIPKGGVIDVSFVKKGLGPFLKLGDVRKLLESAGGGDPKVAGGGIPRRLWTVWFNVRLYETSEQVWAGLVDAIVKQISDRLTPAERELFLLKLHLARIDDRVIRRKIYDRVAEAWWGWGRWWLLSGGVAFLTFLTLLAVKAYVAALTGIAAEVVGRVALFSALCSPAAVGTALIGIYARQKAKIEKQDAKFSLSEFIRVPDYNKHIGTIHQIQEDLGRVLKLAPRLGGVSAAADASSPIVIFVDDLDRCSPSKIAKVVEGVNMFLASDQYRCMFVIGMDPQLIAAALESEHETIAGKLPSYERGAPLGWRFMDKFVQLPFTIPPSSPDRLRAFMDGLGSSPATADLVAEKDELEAEVPWEGDEATIADKTADGVRTPSVIKEKSAGLVERKARESREVGRIILEAGAYAGGNPRELKRIANMARIFLKLGHARSRDAGAAPDYGQYARWIVLSVRWPDVMRWLLWGSDDAGLGAADRATSLACHRLRALEQGAVEADATHKTWAEAMSTRFGADGEDGIAWLQDAKLFAFFRDEGRLPEARRLSTAAAAGFW